MNILFLTIINIKNINDKGIYHDLLRILSENGHQVYVISPIEKKFCTESYIEDANGIHIIHLKVGNLFNVNLIEKGISTIKIEGQIIKAIKKYFSTVNFDLVLYSTPPITFVNAIKFLKQKNNATTYLLLKDIFPQNALDIGLLSKNGIFSILYNFFINKEKQLYSISDYIGCMSEANGNYLIDYKNVDSNKIEIFPNCIKIENRTVAFDEKLEIRKKYGLPADKKIFVYGGNIGKPQNADYIVKALLSVKDNLSICTLIIGDGTDYIKLKTTIEQNSVKNVMFINKLPSDEFTYIVSSCDVGLVFLDNRFTIPNFPSRILSYMSCSLPILACTDICTDLKDKILEGNFGWWIRSDDPNKFSNMVTKILTDDICLKGENSFKYLINNYDINKHYKKIVSKVVKHND